MVHIKTALTSVLLASTVNAALPPIKVKGTKFFYENGTQFYIKGMAYQQDTAAKGATTKSTKYTDPLADTTSCKRDIPLMAQLGVNAIRTYAIDPKADHSECMKLLDAAGIYVISDLGEPSLSINREDPNWDVDLFERYKGVVKELSHYSNVIGFFAGNEVTNDVNNTGASVYVKAAVRDTKAYIAQNVPRWMGVGYAANDDSKIRAHIAQYFNCGEKNASIDYWGYNIYSWCGKDSSFQVSGWDTQVAFFKNYSVPVFFAEYGCNTGGAESRVWEETTVLYGKEMTPVFSGGIVYMYFQEANDYGVVKIQNGKATTMKNYDALKSKLTKVDPEVVSFDSYSPSNKPQECPPIVDTWQAAEALPPTPDKDLCDCMYNSLTCRPSAGLDDSAYTAMFGYICGEHPEACAGIKGDTKNGVYGPYKMCNATYQLGYALNEYYTWQKKADKACKFDGNATINPSPKSDSNCKSKMSSADAKASVAATATGAPAAGQTGGAGGDKSAATAHWSMQPVMSLGNMAVGAYMLVALGVGFGMVML